MHVVCILCLKICTDTVFKQYIHVDTNIAVITMYFTWFPTLPNYPYHSKQTLEIGAKHSKNHM